MPYKKRVSEFLSKSENLVNSDPDNALKTVLELYSESKTSSDYESTGQLCKLIGTLYLKNGQQKLTQDFYFQAISNFKLVNNYKALADVYNNLIVSSYYLHQYDKIEEYSKLALDYYEKSDDISGVVSVTNNLAKFYRNINSFTKAYSILKTTIAKYSERIDEENSIILQANYANVCLNLGKIDEGLKLLLALDAQCDLSNKHHAITVVSLYLTEYYESIGDYQNALKFHKKRFSSTVIGRQVEISTDINNYLHSLNIDIDRLQHERIIKQNNELIEANNKISLENGFLETLINTIPIPLFYCDNDFMYLGCNEAYQLYFKKSKEDIIGKKVGFTLSNQAEIDYLTQKTVEAKRSKKPIHFLSNLTQEDGKTRVVEVFYSIFYNEQNQPSGMLCMFKDITTEIEQQEVVKELNAHLQSVLESASQVYICSIDRNCKYRYFNSNYAKSVKRHINLDIYKGQDYFTRYSSSEEIQAKTKLLERVFAGETVSGVREYLDVEPIEILQYYYSPIIEEDGQIIGATVFSYDITERVLAQKELALSNRTKDKFFSIIAHDLRSPIGNIKSALEFLTSEVDLSQEDMMDMLERLSSSAINTYDLLENLLQWSLTERGLIENNSDYYYLDELIDNSIRISKNIANSKNIDIITYCDKAIRIFADKNMFFTVLRNLINNAIKYSYEHSNIIIKASSDANFAHIQVIDYGVGIKPEVIPYLNQMDKTITTYGTQGEKGSGLGLVLCNELVTKLGGKLWVESEENKGSIFNFTMPVNENY